ncbi:MAG: MucR family transcriptional regulator [Alphaproteobacteria bacterium]|nr:MucR family transcriptional regulator [Alphaproteobacteria bacterium]
MPSILPGRGRIVTDSKPSASQSLRLTAEIVAAYLAQNAVPLPDLPDLIAVVHRSLLGASRPENTGSTVSTATPAVSVRRSVQPDHIVCLECGKAAKLLKRHLRSDHNLTAAKYREKWGLKDDYPLVAPVYAAKRSELALAAGLGRHRRSEGVTS